MADIEQERRAAFAQAFPMGKFAKELAVLFFSDSADYIGTDEGGDYVKSISAISPKKKTKAIKKIKITQLQPVMQADGKGDVIARETQKVEFELYDKVPVARLVADIMGLKAPEITTIQFDEDTLNAILTGLPAGIGEAVRAELGKLVSKKRD